MASSELITTAQADPGPGDDPALDIPSLLACMLAELSVLRVQVQRLHKRVTALESGRSAHRRPSWSH
jgi:hypothetical protein